MSPTRPSGHAPSPPEGDEGVRVLRKSKASRFGIEARLFAGIALVVAVAVALSIDKPSTGASGASASATAAREPRINAPAVPASDVHLAASAVAERLDTAAYGPASARPAASGDPDDLASYFRPGDPVPSTANLIKAMNEAGIRTGIAAFNPPGTSPPLEGLAVPADFPLPPGYVRHHQATDDGVPIEPILMFSPDLVLRDAQGRPIALPANGVVPPELAPPGLPLRWVRPGRP